MAGSKLAIFSYFLFFLIKNYRFWQGFGDFGIILYGYCFFENSRLSISVLGLMIFELFISRDNVENWAFKVSKLWIVFFIFFIYFWIHKESFSSTDAKGFSGFTYFLILKRKPSSMAYVLYLWVCLFWLDLFLAVRIGNMLFYTLTLFLLISEEDLLSL